jgi:hypothetical protein
MRRLLASRYPSATALCALALLAAGGGYAFASGTAAKTIHACVHHRGGGVYIAKKCAKHDRKLSWNQVGPRGPAGPTGPQGPGATDVVYNTAGGGSSTTVTIGRIGPWTVSFNCAESDSMTTATPYFTGPGGSLDGISAGPTSADSISEVFPQLTNDQLNMASSTSTSTASESFEALFVPSSGTSYQVNETTAATGGTTNSCHFAATAVPVSSAASGSAELRGRTTPNAASATKLSGPLFGKG